MYNGLNMTTIVVKRLVTHGHEKEYENQMEQFIDEVKNMDGYMGINIGKPANKDFPLYVFTVKFDTKKNLQKYKESEIRKQYLKELQSISQAPIREQTINRLDWWFALPGQHYDLPHYKMLLLTILAVYPIVLIQNLFLGSVDNFILVALRTLFTVTVTIIIMSYVTLPILLAFSKKWLAPHLH